MCVAPFVILSLSVFFKKEELWTLSRRIFLKAGVVGVLKVSALGFDLQAAHVEVPKSKIALNIEKGIGPDRAHADNSIELPLLPGESEHGHTPGGHKV